MSGLGVLLLILNNHHSCFIENVRANSRIWKCKTISLSQTTVNQTTLNYIFYVICCLQKCDYNIIKFSLDRSGALMEEAKYGCGYNFMLIMYL